MHTDEIYRATFSKYGLFPVMEKTISGARISEGDALSLTRCPEPHLAGMLADRAREKKHGSRATYLHNRYINYSNLCILRCPFCSFARRRGEDGAFEHTAEEIVSMAKDASCDGATELHIVGGLHPSWELEHYLSWLRGIKKVAPSLHVKAFSAIEIRHLASSVFHIGIAKTLNTLRDAGLDSLTGGGAEIFAPPVRRRICRGKETAEEWLEVHRIWHGMGGRSTCTMLYGHIETWEDRIDHLKRLRELQDETGGFTGFIPLPFQPNQSPSFNQTLKNTVPLSSAEHLLNIAVSRLYLDNIQNITAYWVGLGLGLAQAALSYGANDLHGTIHEEKIFHMSGATSPSGITVEQLQKLIEETGQTPCQRDSHYQLLPTR